MTDQPYDATTGAGPVEGDLRGVLVRAAERAEAEAGGAEPRLFLGRLSAEDREDLLAATTAHLQGRRPAPRNAKVVPIEKDVQDWWAKLLGYADGRRQQRLNPLRNEVFTALAEADVIRRQEGLDWKIVAPSRAAAGPLVTRENLGAWVLKANPAVWDVRGWLAEGGEALEDWTVAHNYRSAMMEPGDVVWLWVSGDDPACPSGFRARGAVTGACVAGQGEGARWLNQGARRRADYFARVDVRPLDALIPRHALQHHPALREIEVIRAPFSSNPSYLTPEQVAELESFPGR